MAKLRRRDNALVSLLLLMLTATALAQRPTAAGLQIQGLVLSNKFPIPGVVIVGVSAETHAIATTSTDVNGEYVLKIPASGKYQVTAQIAAFAPETKGVELSDAAKTVRLDFELTLLSRTQRISQQAPAGGRRGGNVPAQAAVEAPVENSDATETLASPQADASVPPGGGALPGMATDAPTESVAVAGNTAQPAFNGMFDENRMNQMGFGPAGFPGGPAGTPGDASGGGGRGGPGGFAGGRGGGPGGPGGFGGRGGPGGRGGRGFALGGQQARRNVNRPNINFSYTLQDSALDAAPYSITGAPVNKPQYSPSRITGTIGAPLYIPKLLAPTPSTSYNVSMNGNIVRTPYDNFATVPTVADRNGDFTPRGLPLQIPTSSFNPASAGLLQYIPLPNLPGNVQNFHYVTTSENNGGSANVRFIHTFGPIQAGPRGGRGGGFGGGGRGGGRGGRGRTTVSFGFNYNATDSTSVNPFPSIHGNNTTRSWNIPLTFSKMFGTISTNTGITYNRNHTSTTNMFANTLNVENQLGITGVSNNPLDWGLPTLSFTNFTGMNDVRPAENLNQVYAFSEGMGWFHGKHNIRFGTDYRHTQLNTHSGTNARGTFTFTGAATGYDFADFLVGLPQLTTIQYGTLNYRFLGHSYDFYIQDDWRALSKLTFNLGLRYDFTAPSTEANGHIVNLDAAPYFTAVAPVLPGQAGPFGGIFPAGLVNPDRNGFGPQLGIAWRALTQTVVRASYGIQYNGNVYAAMVKQFAFQPPFAVVETNITSAHQILTLQNGFPAPTGVTNNYGVDKNYRVGYAQTWNLSIQRDLPRGLLLSMDYTGVKGTRLDVLEAPNRTATGLRIPGVQAFTWEASDGDSIAHTGRIQIRRRLMQGVSFGGNLTWQKSIDDASSFGAGAGNIAQDANNLRGERALSNFDVPFRFNGDYLWQLPFGANRHWMNSENFFSRWFGDWQLQGTYNIAHSTPYTVRIVGLASDIARGTNGVTRPNATGLPVKVGHPTVAQWFNTSAFIAPAAGSYGNAGRNTVFGPLVHQFAASFNKTFVMNDHSMDLRIQATNVFNMPQYQGIDTNYNSQTFGRVISAAQMRTVQIIARYRF